MARIGLVLGSGGLAGIAFHAGVITALWRECGWDARTAEVIVGTSAGSASGMSLRSGLPPEDFVARQTGEALTPEGAAVMAAMRARRPTGEDSWAAVAAGTSPQARAEAPRLQRGPASPETLRAALRRPWAMRPGAVIAAALPQGRLATDELQAAYDALVPVWPEASTWMCATRLADGRRAAFGREKDLPKASPGQAVAASCAVPGYYRPVTIGGQVFVDGAAHSFVNADLVAGLGLDAVLISAPMSTSDVMHFSREHPWRSLTRAQLRREVRQVEASGTRVLVIHPNRDDRAVLAGAAMDPDRRPQIARRSLRSAMRLLADSSDPVVRTLRAEAP